MVEEFVLRLGSLFLGGWFGGHLEGLGEISGRLVEVAMVDELTGFERCSAWRYETFHAALCSSMEEEDEHRCNAGAMSGTNPVG